MQTSMGQPAIDVSGLGKVFNRGTDTQVVALADIDLTVAPGEFMSVIGPSGCGKSTMLRIIADLEQPSSGHVTVNGKSPFQARSDHDFGMAFQQAGLFEWRSVSGNVELPLELMKWGKAQRQARSAELLESVGIAEFSEHRPSALSGGMQQRVAIARALAPRPNLLLMDEPFGALDEMTREQMQDELLRIRRETAATVVFVTHSIPEAVYLSDRIAVMSARPGLITQVVPVDLGERNANTRDDRRFFETISAIREALRKGGASG